MFRVISSVTIRFDFCMWAYFTIIIPYVYFEYLRYERVFGFRVYTFLFYLFVVIDSFITILLLSAVFMV
jgi:hypothetical protein